MVKPRASRAYIMPSARPLMTCWRRTSNVGMERRPGRRSGTPARRPDRLLLRRHPDVLDLPVLPLVDGDGPVGDVAVLVVGDRALDGAQLRGLDRVAEVRPGQRLVRLHRPLGGV